MTDTVSVADQLMILRARLRQAGWTRVNGNTWRCMAEVHQLRTAYVWGEATLELWSKGLLRTTYRGAEPLTWAETDAAPVLRKIFANQLDTEPEAE